MQFFTTEPYACEPSSLPAYPPSKEMDAKRRDEEARRFVTLILISFIICLLFALVLGCLSSTGHSVVVALSF
jgi:hypothetical protein